MKSSFRIHRTMVVILNSLLPNNLYRRDLIRVATSLPEYSTGQKAERFISSQIFRLTKNNLLESVRDHKGLWYKPSFELLELLNEAKRHCPDINLNLEKEGGEIESELTLLLVELKELQELKEKHPSLRYEIDQLILVENDRIKNLNGKLNALKKLTFFLMHNRR